MARVLNLSRAEPRLVSLTEIGNAASVACDYLSKYHAMENKQFPAQLIRLHIGLN